MLVRCGVDCGLSGFGYWNAKAALVGRCPRPLPDLSVASGDDCLRSEPRIFSWHGGRGFGRTKLSHQFLLLAKSIRDTAIPE